MNGVWFRPQSDLTAVGLRKEENELVVLGALRYCVTDKLKVEAELAPSRHEEVEEAVRPPSVEVDAVTPLHKLLCVRFSVGTALALDMSGPV